MHSLISYTFPETKFLKKDAIWKELSKVKIKAALKRFYERLADYTRVSYENSFSVFHTRGVLDLDMDLQNFSMLSRAAVIEKIRSLYTSEHSRQVRCAAYVAFLNYLHRVTDGVIEKAETEKMRGEKKLYKRVRTKVKTKPISKMDWERLLEYTYIRRLNRERLILIFLMQGGKRLGEVLSANIEDIDFARRRVAFKQKKSKYCYQDILITFPEHVFDDLYTYLDGRKSGPIFINKKKPTRCSRITFTRTIKKACDELKIKFHTQMLRASCIAFLRLHGYKEKTIQNITGLTRPQMVRSYDKGDTTQNATSSLDLSKEYDDKSKD